MTSWANDCFLSHHCHLHQLLQTAAAAAALVMMMMMKLMKQAGRLADYCIDSAAGGKHPAAGTTRHIMPCQINRRYNFLLKMNDVIQSLRIAYTSASVVW